MHVALHYIISYIDYSLTFIPFIRKGKNYLVCHAGSRDTLVDPIITDKPWQVVLYMALNKMFYYIYDF